jgi:hypothetical protein
MDIIVGLPRTSRGYNLSGNGKTSVWISFEIHFESREVSIYKVVPLFKTFTTIIYFKFLELEKVLLGSLMFEWI